MGFRSLLLCSRRRSVVKDTTPRSPEMTPPQITRALEYVSKKLQKKGLHVQLIVAGGILPCYHFKTQATCPTISILQVGSPSPKTTTILFDAIASAAKRFNLNPNWINTSIQTEVCPTEVDTVVERSLVQREVVFSSEGLTMLAIDLVFAFKYVLETLTLFPLSFSGRDFDSAVDILRRLVLLHRGRPLTRGFLDSHYRFLEISGEMLLRVNAVYENRFGARGIAGVHDEYMTWWRAGFINCDDKELDQKLVEAVELGAWDEKSVVTEQSHGEMISSIFAGKVVFV